MRPGRQPGGRSRRSLQRQHRAQVLALLNDIRHEHGLPAFVASTALRSAAREHSSDMLTRGYFEHNCPKESFDKRIRRFLKSPLVGENIAWGTG